MKVGLQGNDDGDKAKSDDHGDGMRQGIQNGFER